jgi:UDP-glucose 4-epimerase
LNSVDKNWRCLVLGGSGFLGQHLVHRLLKQGYAVRVLSRRSRDSLTLAQSLGKQVEWIEGDYAQPDTIQRALNGIECVFHLVSSTLPATSNADPLNDVLSNVGSSIALLEFCRTMGIRKVVFFSSGGTVYGAPKVIPTDEDQVCNPVSSYGIQKLTIEKYLGLYHHLHGLETISLRISNPYGPRQRSISSQGFIGVALAKILQGQELIIWGDGTVVRDYIHVEDVMTAAILALEATAVSQTINIGSGLGTSLREVITLLESVSGQIANVTYKPGRSFDVPINILNIDRAKQVLGWVPEIGIKQGVTELVGLWQFQHGKTD